MSIDPETFRHEPADTVHGQLQRGRGAGYLAALELPRAEAHRLLIDCITRDPRLDSQCESRREDYAHLAREVELPLTRLGNHLRVSEKDSGGEERTWLAISTLGALVSLGFCDARGILIDYVNWGHWWIGAIHELIHAGDESWKRLDKAVCSRFPSADAILTNGLTECRSEDEPWVTWWETNGLIREAVTKLQTLEEAADTKYKLTSPDGLSLEELLTKANEENRLRYRIRAKRIVTPADVPLLVEHLTMEKPDSAAIALAALTKCAPSYLFNTVFDFWSRHPEMEPFLAAPCGIVLSEMPSEQVLPIARDYFCHPAERNRELAERLMEAHATPDDIPLLRREARKCFVDPITYYWRLKSIVEALIAFEDYGPIPELLEAFAQMPTCIGRGVAADAIISTSRDVFIERLARECLWDSGHTAKLRGIEFANITDQSVRDRVRQIAIDPLEDDMTRDAAVDRLKSEE